MEFNNSRRLCLSGAPNTRDLGGLKTTDGRTVRSGRLLRSGSLGQLTESDIQLLQSIPLRTVVDFRTDREISEKPDLVPECFHALRLFRPLWQPGNKKGRCGAFSASQRPCFIVQFFRS